ncbi:hypothetical protein CW745_13050 [Psychromonas sp. psych-6C06]|uniref:DUF2141 domain-containing protein n=1 Tax=Psychromonas sp. psych-6C06 TaxID=2058089 RepID=UPI000C341549|nr:DUF2141 domain-containing protein [Psychromonas sp. psych-6C06]PKF60796.1 hypothetical protein CW745_13050 [Psychromonas sp. psych-6C06]
MKILSIVLLLGLILSLSLTAKPPVNEVLVNDGKLHQLTVELHQVNSEYKSVYLYVYDEAEERVFSKTISPAQAMQPIIFEGVESGSYAIYAHQNKDDDPTLNTSPAGVPLEPLGFANNPVLMGPPAFQDISVGISEDTKVSINLMTYG